MRAAIKTEAKAFGRIVKFVFEIVLGVAVFYGFVISLVILSN